MILTRQEADRVRKLVETEDWARKAFEQEKTPLIRYLIAGDKAAAEVEKQALLGALKAGKVASVGNAYRYDVLYDLLTPQERERIKAAFVSAVERGMDDMSKIRHYTRWNWLPNLNYKWYSNLHVMAAATGDEKLIRKFFAGPNAFKWYLDEYLSDLGFYNEEFSKMFNTPQGLVAWCWALERIGLDELGWGYKGRQGATMRGHIDSILRLGFPRIDMGTSRYNYPRLTIGDTRGGSGGVPAFGFQHNIVGGALAQGNVRDSKSDWYVDLLHYAHAKWPDDGYGYFLAQMRAPEDDRYVLPISFGVPPIDPRTVKPPPAPSGVYPGRGLVVLRADESPAYWESPAPAVGMRLATPYAHHVQDSFALVGFYAFNRPIFVNHGHSTNYTGVDPGYSNSAKSHSIVLVDRAEPNSLLDAVQTRHDFGDRVKFAAARAKGIFEGVDQTRALLLTREYLLDVSHLLSDRPRDYLWQIHTFGHACPDQPEQWGPSRDLAGSLPDLGHEQSAATDQTWSVTCVQSSGGANPLYSGFGESWFKRRVGVRTTMLGEKGTRAYTAWAPVVTDTSGRFGGRNRFAYGEDEPAGAAIVANRRANNATFVAVHEPFENTPRVRAITRLYQDQRSVVLAIEFDGFTDYIALQLDDPSNGPAVMTINGRDVRFSNYVHIRRGGADAKAAGDAKADLSPLFAIELSKNSRQGPVAARWQIPSGLCLPTGGKASATLKLRNNGLTSASGNLKLVATKGIKVDPQTITLDKLAAGAEIDVAVSVDAAKAAANELAELAVVTGEPNLSVQRAVLPVANGVTFKREQLGGDWVCSVYAPRYIARYWYMEAGAATELLDPAGYRRNDSSGASYPSLVRTEESGGKKRTESVNIPKFPYFIPIIVNGASGEPRFLYEGGKHAHGTQSGLEHRFTEDWIIVRSRIAQPGEMIAYDFFRESRKNSLDDTVVGRDTQLAAEKAPGVALIVDDQGKLLQSTASDKTRNKLSWPKASKVTAAFMRPHGYEHGMAIFYPKGSEMQGRYIYHPGDQAVAFTFCTEKEFAELLKRWQQNPPGDINPADAGRYHGAFGASPVRAQ